LPVWMRQFFKGLPGCKMMHPERSIRHKTDFPGGWLAPKFKMAGSTHRLYIIFQPCPIICRVRQMDAGRKAGAAAMPRRWRGWTKSFLTEISAYGRTRLHGASIWPIVADSHIIPYPRKVVNQIHHAALGRQTATGRPWTSTDFKSCFVQLLFVELFIFSG